MKAPTACERCEVGPAGMAGHERLALMPLARNTVPTAHFVLRCLDCGSEWRRDFAAGSSVRWLRTAAASALRIDLFRKS